MLPVQDIVKNNNDLFKVRNASFNRIKRDLLFGRRHESASESEIVELKSIINYYTAEKAQKMFNADWMATYPIDLGGNVYEEKYTNCNAVVVVGKTGFDIFFYFMMTDESSKDFDKYLNFLEKAFWFN